MIKKFLSIFISKFKILLQSDVSGNKKKPKNQDYYANQIFIQLEQSKKQTSKSELPNQSSSPQPSPRKNDNSSQVSNNIKTIYLPGYLRLKIKNFTSLDIESLNAEMNATLIFSVFYGNLAKIMNIQQQLMSKIVLNFNRDNALQLSEQLQITLNHDEKNNIFTYTVRRIFNSRITCEIFWSPFQIIDLIFTVTLQKVAAKLKNGNKCQIKFNLMNHQSNYIKLSYSQQGTFGLYDLAQSLLLMEPSNEQTTQKILKQNQEREKQRKAFKKKKILPQKLIPQEKKGLKDNQIKEKQKQNNKKNIEFKKNYQYGHFVIPLYRFPLTSVTAVFLPLVLLGILNLGIFFQDRQLSNRIASIASLMLAFVGLIPIIRQQTPPSPSITFIQYLVFIQALTSLLCLMQSFSVMNKEEFQFVFYLDIYFMLSLILNLFQIAIILCMYLAHKYIWQPRYNRFLSEQTDVKFMKSEWFHKNCSEKLLNAKQKIKPLQSFNIQIFQPGYKQPIIELNQININQMKMKNTQSNLEQIVQVKNQSNTHQYFTQQQRQNMQNFKSNPKQQQQDYIKKQQIYFGQNMNKSIYQNTKDLFFGQSQQKIVQLELQNQNSHQQIYNDPMIRSSWHQQLQNNDLRYTDNFFIDPKPPKVEIKEEKQVNFFSQQAKVNQAEIQVKQKEQVIEQKIETEKLNQGQNISQNQRKIQQNIQIKKEKELNIQIESGQNIEQNIEINKDNQVNSIVQNENKQVNSQIANSGFLIEDSEQGQQKISIQDGKFILDSQKQQ